MVRIIIGPGEIGAFGSDLAHAWFSMGTVADQFYFTRGPSTGTRTHLSANPVSEILTRTRVFRSILREYDVFIFNSFHTWLPRFLDLPILKRRGKRIVFIFHGCDVRANDPNTHACCQYCHGCNTPARYNGRTISEMEYRLIALKHIERYADVIYARSEYADLLLRPYRPLWLPVRVRSYVPRPEREKVFIYQAAARIDHADGRLVDEAVKRLIDEGWNIHWRQDIAVPHDVVMRRLDLADIAISRLRFEYSGLFSFEALAAGCVVLDHLDMSRVNGVPSPPVIRTSRATILDDLRDVLQNRSAWPEIGMRGRRWINENHEVSRIADRMLKEMMEAA